MAFNQISTRIKALTLVALAGTYIGLGVYNMEDFPPHYQGEVEHAEIREVRVTAVGDNNCVDCERKFKGWKVEIYTNDNSKFTVRDFNGNFKFDENDEIHLDYGTIPNDLEQMLPVIGKRVMQEDNLPKVAKERYSILN